MNVGCAQGSSTCSVSYFPGEVGQYSRHATLLQVASFTAVSDLFFAVHGFLGRSVLSDPIESFTSLEPNLLREQPLAMGHHPLARIEVNTEVVAGQLKNTPDWCRQIDFSWRYTRAEGDSGCTVSPDTEME